MTDRKHPTAPSGGRKDQENRTRDEGSDANTPGQQARGRDQKRPGSESNPEKDD